MAHKKKSSIHSHDATRPTHADAMSEINITPMIDVLLVLLIIFMVVTPVAQRGLDIALPQPPPPNQERTEQPQTVVLDISETGYLVNKTPVASLEDLDARLRDIFQAKQDKTIFVKGQGKLPYGRIVEAMDVARGAGVERIGIISDKLIEESGGLVESGE